MSVLTFKGGIHPFEGKGMSKKRSIKDFKPEGEIVIPVSQHIGSPATPIVKVGDKVLVGQKIAEASGFISANIHSSVSGEVKAIEPRMVTNGSKVISIIIDNDNMYQEAPVSDFEKLNDMSPSDIRTLIKEAGIVGMGGAGFPTNVKLSPRNEDEIEYIIVNGAECEPYLTSDYRRMMEDPDILIEGLKVCLKLFPKAKGYIAIEDNKIDAIIKLRDMVRKEERIEVKKLYTKYPQGGERSLIYATTGRELNSSMLPADAGCIVHNVDTIFAIYQAVINKKPLIARIVTVTGDAIRKPNNYKVPIGTNIRELINVSGGFKCQPEKIISGGPMMGTALYNLDIPVVKGTSAILCFEKDEIASSEASNCIKCGRCVGVCPSRLIPSKLAMFSDNGANEEFEKLDGMECVECGCCSYICPAKRNLTQSIKTMKKDILASRRKK